MHDYYRILGVARDASPQLAKIAFEGRMKALADPAYAAPPAEKREEERLLREALVTLTMPAKRGPYDAKLAAFEEAGSRRPSRPAWLVPSALAVVALAAGAGWLEHSREQGRLQADRERQRLAGEAQAERRRAEAEAHEARVREMQDRREEAAAASRERSETYRIQRERAEYERLRRAQEAQARSAQQAAERQERNALYAKQREEEQLRREEESRRRQALVEVERQKEYLRRLELEEERARAARHERAEREAREREYQRILEERRRRMEEPR